MIPSIDNYRKYRWFITSSGKTVIGGKNAVQNEELLHLVKREKKDFIIMHTSSPGSPFSVIFDDIKKISKKDLEEMATFTACFSQAWKSGRVAARVDIFKTNQLSKSAKMKTGTWGVAGEVETVIVPLELYLTLQEKIVRAVPENAAKQKLLRILPGKIDKADMIAKIQLEAGQQFKQDELLSALPAGGIKIEKIKKGKNK
jgi:hypothetical protein